MRSQFLIIYSILIILITILFYGSLVNNQLIDYGYKDRSLKYIAEHLNFLRKQYGCKNINETIYNYCSQIGGLCFCDENFTYVIFSDTYYKLS